MPITLRQLRAQVEELAAEAFGIFDDGKITAEEAISVLPNLVRDAMTLAGNVQGLSGSRRKELVIDAVKLAYVTLDPDWPFVPQWIEEPLERVLLNTLVPPLVETLYNLLPEAFQGAD